MIAIPSQLRNRTLLLASLGLAFPLSLFAQSISPSLAPMLTDNPQTEPVITLAPDLLLPTRTFIYDATGSSLASNGLTPFVYANSQGIAPTQTDTQIRDSSQTGHISPYISGAASRLGLGSASGEGDSSMPSALMSSGFSTGISPGQMGGPGFGGNSIGSAGSSWGSSSSSFGSNSSDPSWGTGKLRVQRIGRSQTDSSDSGLSQSGDRSAIAGGSSGSTSSLSSTGSSYGSRGHRLGSSSQTGSLSRTGRMGASSGGSRSASMAGSNNGSVAGESISNSSGGISEGDQPEGSASASMYGSSSSGAFGSHSGTNSHQGVSGSGSGENSASGEALNFMPKSAPEPAFGSSPFSSPSGEGELTFLNPSILRVTTPMHSLSEAHSGDERASTYGLRQKLNTHGGLAGSNTHYGLNPHLQGGNSLKSKNKMSTHIQTGLPSSGHP